jgi:hypothetical protein
MNVVKKRSDVIENLVTFEKLLNSKKADERDQAINLVLNDPMVIIYKVLGENHFGPVSFVGNKKASFAEQKALSEEDLKEIKKAVIDVVGTGFTNETTVEKYKEYAKTLGKKIPNVDRTFWRVKDERGKNLNLNEKDLGKK